METMTGRTSTTFKGAEVNQGSVSFMTEGSNRMLRLSDDFKVPGAPAPHWQVVDRSGDTYLLQRLVVAGEKYHQAVTLPAHVGSVARVQIWCAFAEVLLGEAMFEPAVG